MGQIYQRRRTRNMFKNLGFHYIFQIKLKKRSAKTRWVNYRWTMKYQTSLRKRSICISERWPSDFIFCWRLFNPSFLFSKLKEIHIIFNIMNLSRFNIFIRRNSYMCYAGGKFSRFRFNSNTALKYLYHWPTLSYLINIKRICQRRTVTHGQGRFVSGINEKDYCCRNMMKNRLLNYPACSFFGQLKFVKKKRKRFDGADQRKISAPKSRIDCPMMNRRTQNLYRTEMLKYKTRSSGACYELDASQLICIEQAIQFTSKYQVPISVSNRTHQEYCAFEDRGSICLCCRAEIVPCDENTNPFNRWNMPALVASVCLRQRPHEPVWLCGNQIERVLVIQKTTNASELMLPRICDPALLVVTENVSTLVKYVHSWMFPIATKMKTVESEQFIAFSWTCRFVVTFHLLLLYGFLCVYRTIKLVSNILYLVQTQRATELCSGNLDKLIETGLMRKNSNAFLKDNSTKMSKLSSSQFLWFCRNRKISISHKFTRKLKDLFHQLSRKVHSSFEKHPCMINARENSIKSKPNAWESLKLIETFQYAESHQAPFTITARSTSFFSGKKNKCNPSSVNMNDLSLLLDKRELKCMSNNCFLKEVEPNKSIIRVTDPGVHCHREANQCRKYISDARVNAEGEIMKTQQIFSTIQIPPCNQVLQAEYCKPFATDNFLEPGEITQVFELYRLEKAKRSQPKKSPQLAPDKKVCGVKQSKITQIRRYSKSNLLHEHNCRKNPRTVFKNHKVNLPTKLLNNCLHTNTHLINQHIHRGNDHRFQNRNNVSEHENKIIDYQMHAQCRPSSLRTTKPVVRGCSACCVRTRRYIKPKSNKLPWTDLTKPQLITLEEADNKRFCSTPSSECANSICRAKERYRDIHSELTDVTTTLSNPIPKSQFTLDRDESMELNFFGYHRRISKRKWTVAPLTKQ